MRSNVKEVVIRALKRGGIGVLATDTIYGILGSALKLKTVERIYRLRKRNRRKPFIVLIATIRDLARFNAEPDPKTKRILRKFWPGPVSIILPLRQAQNKRASKRFAYLHRGTNALAFRVPKPVWLRVLLSKTGPLVAPSANPEGKPPATTISEAHAYFGKRVDFYADTSTLFRAGAGKRTAQPRKTAAPRGTERIYGALRSRGKPSTLIRIANGTIEILRPGAMRIKQANKNLTR